MSSKDFDLALYNNEFMDYAIGEAQMSEKEGGIPIGSVIVKEGKIIGGGHNRRVQENNPILHAELCCIQNSVKKCLDLSGATLYTTHMPCFLCSGAIVQFGVSRVVAGEARTFPHARNFLENNGIEVVDLDLYRCKKILQDFIASHQEFWNGVSKNNLYKGNHTEEKKIIIPYKTNVSVNFYQYPTPVEADDSEKSFLIDRLELAREMPDKKEFTLFVSIPYCRMKCNSCAFFKNLVPPNKRDVEVLDAYLSSVIKQIRSYAGTIRFSNAHCSAVYIGGGTASLLSSRQCEVLVGEIKKSFKLTKDVEITLEGNPLDFNKKYLTEVRNAGVNRVSIGLQSFKEAVLEKSLNCSHNNRIGARAVKNATELGFNTVNVDLLYGVPCQKESDWHSDIKRIIKMSPSSITIYRYVIYSNSVSEQRIDKALLEKPASEKEIFGLYLWANRELLKAGYFEKRFGCFSKPGHDQKYSDYSYNLSYESIGIGAGAYSFINGYLFKASNDVKKFKTNMDHGVFAIGDYISIKSTEKNRIERYVINNLFCGILKRNQFRNTFKSDPLEIFPGTFAKLWRYGLVTVDKDHIRLTILGKRYIRNVLYDFYAEELKTK